MKKFNFFLSVLMISGFSFAQEAEIKDGQGSILSTEVVEKRVNLISEPERSPVIKSDPQKPFFPKPAYGGTVSYHNGKFIETWHEALGGKWEYHHPTNTYDNLDECQKKEFNSLIKKEQPIERQLATFPLKVGNMAINQPSFLTYISVPASLITAALVVLMSTVITNVVRVKKYKLLAGLKFGVTLGCAFLIYLGVNNFIAKGKKQKLNLENELEEIYRKKLDLLGGWKHYSKDDIIRTC